MILRRPKHQRRRGGSRGIALAEALVALAVAAMTLSLITGATWGLRQASERRAALDMPGPAEWLTTRRALQAWAAGLTAEAAQSAEGRILGTPSLARIVVESAPAHTAELRIEEDEGRYRLVAARHLGQADARLAQPDIRETILLETAEPMRLSYYLRAEGGPVWRPETGRDLPRAIAIDVGGVRRATAPVHATRGAPCLAAFGLTGLEEPRCRLR